MKRKLVIFILIPLLLCCKEKEITPVVKVQPVLQGQWAFDIGYIQANFNIELVNNQLVIQSGTFTGKDLVGVLHTLTIDTQFVIPSDTSQLQLLNNSNGLHGVVIGIDSVSKDLKTMYTRSITGTIVDGVTFQYNDLYHVTKK